MYAAATYLAGIMALSQDQADAAEDLFCKLTRGSGQGRTTFYLSDDAARVIDHAWLALARLRHDRGDYRRAIDTYARIPDDSPAAPQARYEEAWSLYRAGDLARARLALRRLLSSGDDLPDRPMAQLLLGYALLGDCLFEQATGLFEQLEREQNGLVAALTGVGFDIPTACCQAAKIGRLAGELTRPDAGTQVMEIIRHIPEGTAKLLITDKDKL